IGVGAVVQQQAQAVEVLVDDWPGDHRHVGLVEDRVGIDALVLDQVADGGGILAIHCLGQFQRLALEVIRGAERLPGRRRRDRAGHQAAEDEQPGHSRRAQMSMPTFHVVSLPWGYSSGMSSGLYGWPSPCRYRAQRPISFVRGMS